MSNDSAVSSQKMSFAFFRGEDVFPKGQFRVPPYLRNYAKPAFRHPEDDNNTNTDCQQLSAVLDDTIKVRSIGKTDSLSSIRNPANNKLYVEQGNAKIKQTTTAATEKLEKPIGVSAEMNKNQLVDLHRSIQTRLTSTGLESVDLYPLAGMRCTGQRMSLAESQQNPSKRGSMQEEVSKENLTRDEQVVSNRATISGTANSSHAVSLNKLYSCLKKMKGRRNEIGKYEDLATISMNGREPGFSRSYFHRVLAANNSKHSQTRGEQEEIFLLLGGKSKPVRFQINPEGLNLLEKEWRVELKSRDSIFCNSDEEGLQLLQKFRARFRLGKQSTILDRKTPSLPIPWARHVVHKGRCQSPEEKDQLGEDESDRKLSIHVYLPNAGWDEQSVPGTPMLSRSR